MVFTIAILTHNEEENISSLLQSLLKCRLIEVSEIIVIDSQSTDQTVALAKKFTGQFSSLKIVSIPYVKFNYGTTRNRILKYSNGTYICYISADAKVKSLDFLTRFKECLQENYKHIAIFGKEIVPIGTRIGFAQKEQILWFKQYEEYMDDKGRVIFNKKTRNNAKNFKDSIFWYSLSNVFSCYKRSFLVKHPFDTIFHGEDVLMGKKIMDLGYTKIYDSRCVVSHSHVGIRNYIKRNINDWYFRIFVLKSGLKLNLQSKRVYIKNKYLIVNIAEMLRLYFMYIIKLYVLFVVYLLRLKHLVLMRLFKYKKREYIRKYI